MSGNGTIDESVLRAWTRKTIALVVDALTAIPWFVAAPLVRAWHLRWGATADELHGAMPGDEVVPRAQFNATRAVTVDAPPERVWPWIVQSGYRRAGFYTYDLIDNASQRSAERILEEYQHPAVGDLMPMFKELHGLAIAYTVTAFETCPDLRATALLRELRDGYAYTGSYSSLRRRVVELRPRDDAEPEIRFETGPGIQTQGDWAMSGPGRSATAHASCSPATPPGAWTPAYRPAGALA